MAEITKIKRDLIFDSIKENFLYMLGGKSPVPVDENDLFIDYGTELDDRFAQYLYLLQEQVNSLSMAKEKNDEHCNAVYFIEIKNQCDEPV